MIVLMVMEDAHKHVTVHVCRAKSCTRRGAGELAAGLAETFAREGVEAAVTRHDCFDLCKRACNALVETPATEPRLYTGLRPRQAAMFARSIVDELREALTPAGG